MTNSLIGCNPPAGENTEWNVLGVLDVDYSPASVVQKVDDLAHFEIDLMFYIPSGMKYQALEFDPDMTLKDSGTFVPWTYWGSVECDSASGDWRYFKSDNSDSDWVDTETPCSSVYTSAGGWISGWHHLQMYVTMEPSVHQYTYQQVIADGSSVISDPITVGACDGSVPSSSNGHCYNWSERIWVEQQLDNNSGSSSNPEQAYYDYYTLTVW